MTVSASTARLRLTLAWYVIILLLVAVSERLCAHGLLGQIASVAGLLLMAAAALGRTWTSLFIAGCKDSQLVTDGPYAACRHPLYGWSLLGGVGIGFATGSFVLTIATAIVLLVLYWRAILVEERLLLERYGETFRRYRAQVPRLWPALRRYAPPSRIEVNVPVYAKAFRDAGSFILIFALLELLDALRAHDLLPTLLTLW